jgi:diguanylate cyclase (GGDEF)-like protein
MSTWNEAIAELQVEYLREAPAKIEGLDAHIDHVAQAPSDNDALSGLLRLFHSFSGSGRSYGFAAVSDLGRDGESRCNAVRFSGRATPNDVRYWRGLAAQLRTELSHAAQGDTLAAAFASPSYADPSAQDVLVVDDDTAINQLIREWLSKEGFAASPASSLSEARALLAGRLPKAVIVDVVLPDGKGYELVEELRGMAGGEDVAVIVISVRGAFVDRVDAIHCGADAFFEKPVDWDALISRLRRLLDSKRIDAARVLSVEDDPQQAAFVKAVLESAGYQVRVCADPRQLEADLSAFQPDLVLMDVMLPGMSGFDLVRYLRQEEKHATLPVLILTTESQLTARIEGSRAGADDYLIKPVTPALLLSAVASRLERARLLKGLIEHDGLTRLLTHTAFVGRAQTALQRQRRQPSRPVAWVMLDVDHFKSVNDRFGHPVGDRVLTALATHLRLHLRQTDVIGRYGGEEFGIILEDLSEADAMRLLSRLRDEFAAQTHNAPDGTAFQVTFSGGVAMLEAEASLDSWRTAADAALYGAKNAGRNCVLSASTIEFQAQPRAARAKRAA